MTKKPEFFDPIDLGLNIKFDPIIQDNFKFEPLIQQEKTSSETALSSDIKDMANEFKKDYDDLSRGLAYMKNDFAPKIKGLAFKIKNIRFKNPNSYNATLLKDTSDY